MLGWFNSRMIESSRFYASERREGHDFVVSVLKYLLHGHNPTRSILLSLVHNTKSAFSHGFDYGVADRRSLRPVLVLIDSMQCRTFMFISTFKQELQPRRISQQMQQHGILWYKAGYHRTVRGKASFWWWYGDWNGCTITGTSFIMCCSLLLFYVWRMRSAEKSLEVLVTLCGRSFQWVLRYTGELCAYVILQWVGRSIGYSVRNRPSPIWLFNPSVWVVDRVRLVFQLFVLLFTIVLRELHPFDKPYAYPICASSAK